MRLDRALIADLGRALRLRPLQAFIAIELVAAAVLVWRRGPELLSTVVLVWLGMLILAFFVETYGWVFVGLVVPGYLASVTVVNPVSLRCS